MTEARYRTPEGGVELFGEERLHATLRTVRGASASRITARIESAIADFHAGQAADDLALVVLRVTNDATGE